MAVDETVSEQSDKQTTSEELDETHVLTQGMDDLDLHSIRLVVEAYMRGFVGLSRSGVWNWSVRHFRQGKGRTNWTGTGSS